MYQLKTGIVRVSQQDPSICCLQETHFIHTQNAERQTHAERQKLTETCRDTETHAETLTDTHRDSHRETDTETHIYRQRQRHRDRHTQRHTTIYKS